MQNRKYSGAHDGEQRHAFGEAIDRAAPALKHQKQHRRDKRAGVRQADPPHEIDDRERPRHRDVDAPNPDAANQQPRYGDEKQREQCARNQKPEEPRTRLSILQHDRADRRVEALECWLAGEEVCRITERGRCVVGFHGRARPPGAPETRVTVANKDGRPGGPSLPILFQFIVWVADFREIRRARPRVQFREHAVVKRRAF